MKKIQLLILAALFFVGAARGATFTVNSALDGTDANPGDGVCATSINRCSLRAAIEEANQTFAADIIEFAIAGAGVKTISPNSPLPIILYAVEIRGWSQSGGPSYTGPPLIELDGSNAGVANGLTLTENSNKINGLIINRFAQAGINLNNSTGNSIFGCYIGTDATGTIDLGNGTGISSGFNGGVNNQIGGGAPGYRNVISGNGTGILMIGGSSNTIVGNYIGTNANGTAALGNDTGISITNTGGVNIIGGASAGERNVISGNRDGITLISNANFARIYGNYIGTDAGGVSGLGNTENGIEIVNSSNAEIGGAVGAPNIIAYNGADGVRVLESGGSRATGNNIMENSIYSNGGLGIDLSSDGVTANDLNDADAGANDTQNFPVITGAIRDGNTTVTVTLNSQVFTSYRIRIFVSDACDASGYGEGQTYITNRLVTTDGSGNAAFTVGIGTSGTLGQFITATATRDPAPTNTSEFSQCKQVVNPNSVVVTNANDSGAGSLRQAMINANLASGLETITFNIPGAGVHTINLLSELPFVSDPVTIDGESQPGYSGTPLVELNGTSVGGDFIATGLEFRLDSSSGSTVRGLAINRFKGAGIRLAGSNGVTIQSCYIGTDATGTIALGNMDGIRIDDSANNLIGGALPTQRNVISGNSGLTVNGQFHPGTGIEFTDGVSGNRIIGNYIGTNRSGAAALGNGTGVKTREGAAGTFIGGTLAGERNVISGNTTSGVELASDDNVVVGNYIGTDAAGTADLGNDATGVKILSGSNNRIGGTAAGETNRIAFNGVGVSIAAGIGNSIRGNSFFSNASLGIDLGAVGVTLNDAGDADSGANNLQNYPVLTNVFNASGATTVEGTFNSLANTSFSLDFYTSQLCDATGYGEGETFVGSANVTTDANGNAAFIFTPTALVPLGRFVTATANRTGVPLDTSEFSQCVQNANPNSLVVTNTANAGAGSLRQAILNANANAGFDNITFNIAGTGVRTINLLSALPTITDAVNINGASQPGFAGVPLIELNGAGAGAVSGLNVTAGDSTVRSLIVNRFLDGIVISAGGGNTIRGCYIGTDSTGTIDLGNSFQGVSISSANNVVGGGVAAARNLISGNNLSGVRIAGASATGNTVSGNYIGTSASGAADLGNTENGVSIVGGAFDNHIGGTTAGERNVISGNKLGVQLTGDANGSGGNVVIGNYIGTTASGSAALGNSGAGIQVTGSANNRIGGAAASRRNVVSGNSAASAHGISILGALSTGNRILGNYIGTGADGVTDLGNSSFGIQVTDSPNNQIGGVQAGEGNTIAFNDSGGISIFLETATGNSILGNSIFSNDLLGIDLSLNGVSANDAGDPDTGGNNLQNYPVITDASSGGTRVVGTFNSTPATQFRLEFFNSPTADASGSGEGKFCVGAVNVTTGAGGNANFDQTFTANSPAGSFISATATNIATGDTSEFSVAKQVVDPTAGTVSVGGRVTDAAGRGVPSARILLTDASGNARETRTNSLGYYHFADVAAGETYVFTATHKRYEFTPQVVFVGEDASDFNFVALSKSPLGNEF